MKMFEDDRETTIPLNERPDLHDKQQLVRLVHMIDFVRNNRHLHEQLYQLYSRGPVWDGDVISKTERDELLKIGACVKVCMKGEDGYNACSYGGRTLLHIFNWMHGDMK